MTSICFGIRLDLDGLILGLSLEIFSSTFVKMVGLQSIKDSSDIFSSFLPRCFLHFFSKLRSGHKVSTRVG